MSKVIIADECAFLFYKELQLNRNNRYIVYRLSGDQKSFVVDKIQEIDGKIDPVRDYNNFLGTLSEDSPRFIAYNFTWLDSDSERSGRKLVLINWLPGKSSAKEKTLYESYSGELHERLRGIEMTITGANVEELSYEKVMEKLRTA